MIARALVRQDPFEVRGNGEQILDVRGRQPMRP